MTRPLPRFTLFFWIVRGDYLIRVVACADAVPDDGEIAGHVAFAAGAISDSVRLR